MVNKNIGKLDNVIRAAIRTAKSINRGPIPNPDINQLDRVIANSTNIDAAPDTFIWSVHNWGSKQYKVGK